MNLFENKITLTLEHVTEADAVNGSPVVRVLPNTPCLLARVGVPCANR